MLTIDDLDALAHEAFELEDPAPIAARLVEAVEQGRLADPADAPHALLLASEVTERTGDLAAALVLAERAVAAGGDAFARSCVGELLLRTGRADEGMALFEELRPELLRDPLAASFVSESMEAGGRGETVEQWLTSAAQALLDEARAAGEPDYDKMQVVYALIKERHRVREELELPHDEMDGLFHEMQQAIEAGEPDEGRAVLFWPEAEFTELISRWPDRATEYGKDWDEHRAGLERTLAGWSSSGAMRLGIFPGSVTALVAFADGEKADPGTVETHSAYAEEIGEYSPVREWPPQRNAPCWCDSGAKYKKCCLPRARD
ncbi:SEC-C domain-containing protein [Actinoplanes sp. NPDC051851]|uniref:SEC-C domain-containing protein n=1 Tax=Actinoplanes sp. NPDC051851 TaxID=3154753 RepID=UPI00341CADCA